ncbi:MAG: HEAT repeat domain-containing protein [Dehalococcoidales bacterium]|nr:HEAT repeat domain-containing protein [Dehalococcoidales bacterium]
MLSPIEEIITQLADSSKPLLNSSLADLSNITTEKLNFLKEVWPAIESQRRRQIVSRLVELAEDNFELDFDSIFKNCLSDQDAEVRSKAIEGLWENEEPSLIHTLIAIMEQDNSKLVQAAAATGLGKFTTLAEQQKLRPAYTSKIYRALLAVIDDRNKPVEVRRRALEAIAPLDSPEVEKAIGEAYRSSNRTLRISAIYAMGRNGNPSWLSIILDEAGSPDAEIRYEVARACGELGEEEAVPYLINLAADPDIEIQLAAIEALGQTGGTEAKNFLEQCLDASNEVVQQAAEQALNELQAEGEDSPPF